MTCRRGCKSFVWTPAAKELHGCKRRWTVWGGMTCAKWRQLWHCPHGDPKRTNLYHIVILCVSQPRNGRRLPGPPVYTSFWGDGKPPWLGGPKAHSPHDMFMDAGFESHGNRTSPHHPVGLLRWPRQR